MHFYAIYNRFSNRTPASIEFLTSMFAGFFSTDVGFVYLNSTGKVASAFAAGSVSNSFLLKLEQSCRFQPGLSGLGDCAIPDDLGGISFSYFLNCLENLIDATVDAGTRTNTKTDLEIKEGRNSGSLSIFTRYPASHNN